MSAAATVRRLILPMTAPVGSVRAVRPNRELAVLTYDDGPQPGGTDKVLAALADARSTATFFILVGRARKHRTLLREVVAAGHEIALHGIDHVRLTTMPPGDVRRRTKDGKHQLEDLAGQQVRWFRPPYGAQRPGTWAAVRSTGLMPVVWSNEVADWQDDTVDQLSERARSVRAGSVLLLHDGYADEFDGVDDGPAPGFDRGELSRRILGELDQRGIATASLGDALAAGTAVRGAWFRG
ncbi:MAG TPA: polysaccharide deacetylase family protein [Pseudonocardiaceae bacterium]|nr:polysaccharide deacetylase family protein [Pseudonocardiaceae bacterium]